MGRVMQGLRVRRKDAVVSPECVNEGTKLYPGRWKEADLSYTNAYIEKIQDRSHVVAG